MVFFVCTLFAFDIYKLPDYFHAFFLFMITENKLEAEVGKQKRATTLLGKSIV